MAAAASFDEGELVWVEVTLNVMVMGVMVMALMLIAMMVVMVIEEAM